MTTTLAVLLRAKGVELWIYELHSVSEAWDDSVVESGGGIHAKSLSSRLLAGHTVVGKLLTDSGDHVGGQAPRGDREDIVSASELLDRVEALALQKSHSVVTSVHVFKALLDARPASVDDILERYRELHAARFPLRNSILGNLGDHAERNVEDLLREIGPEPPSAESVGNVVDRYLASRFYPFDDAKYALASNTIKAGASSEWTDVLVFTASHLQVMSK